MGQAGQTAQANRTDQHNTADFLPGLNNVPWGAMVNGNFIVLSGMAVLRNHALVVNDALIEIYPQWNTVQDKLSAKPAFSLPTRVRTYEAQTGFIYRAFVLAPKAPISCLDILIPYTGIRAATGAVHYKEAGVDYTARFIPARLMD